MSARAVDVCVIGGGPAGSVMAARLAQLGLEVCLVERDVFPRPRLGESLSPGVRPLLDVAGARHAVEQSGLRVRRVRSNWDGAWTERVDPREEGVLVDRGRFDALLVAHARAVGVAVLQPATIRRRTRDDDVWRLTMETRGTTRVVRARFLVDAAGRAAALPGRRIRTGPRTVALYQYWEGAQVPSAPRIEAGTDAWYWGVPLPGGRYNTLAFVDAGSLRAHAGAREAYFHALLERSSLMEGCTAPRPVGCVLAADATPYLDERCVSPVHIKVGDAALAIDPLSSSGVQKAVQSALSGAVVVNTLVRRPEEAEVAQRFYRDSLTQASDRHRVWAAGHYATVSARGVSSFWRARSTQRHGMAVPASSLSASSPADVSAQIGSEARVRLSPQAQLVEAPRLDAEFVSVGAALRHPALDAPVAFVGGWELAPLVRELGAGMTPLQLVRSWSPRVPLASGIAIAGWMLGHGILVPGADETRP